MDETYVLAFVSYKNHVFYQNKKWFLSQNVLVAVIFNLQYCYILQSWEDSGHNSYVLADEVQNQGFIIPED